MPVINSPTSVFAPSPRTSELSIVTDENENYVRISIHTENISNQDFSKVIEKKIIKIGTKNTSSLKRPNPAGYRLTPPELGDRSNQSCALNSIHGVYLLVGENRFEAVLERSGRSKIPKSREKETWTVKFGNILLSERCTMIAIDRVSNIQKSNLKIFEIIFRHEKKIDFFSNFFQSKNLPLDSKRAKS